MPAKTPDIEARILRAATKAFCLYGFKGARMQQIADQAGVNKALLHYYYRSKQNLFDAVQAQADTALDTLWNTLLHPANSLPDTLAAFSAGCLAVHREGGLPLGLPPLPATAPPRMSDWVAQQIAEGSELGFLRVPDVEGAVWHLLMWGFGPLQAAQGVQSAVNSPPDQSDAWLRAYFTALPDRFMATLRAGS